MYLHPLLMILQFLRRESMLLDYIP